jgi:hypothetical protein
LIHIYGIKKQSIPYHKILKAEDSDERITYSLSASTTIGASFSANQEVVKIKSSDPKF